MASFRQRLRERLRPDALAASAGQRLPQSVLRRVLGESLRGLGASLCLHRVAEADRPTDWQPGLNSPPGQLDELLELLSSSRPGPAEGWLSATFDDGYEDSAAYIASRAARFAHVEFVFFVCPEKLEKHSGFRWDAAELAMSAGVPRDEAVRLLDAPLAKRPEFRLASLESLDALSRLPNVRIGNHTNCHLSAARFADGVVREDYRRSHETFTRLFGPVREFAFPYGTPHHHFEQRHVDMLRALGDFTIWSTEARPYRLAERRPGAVLPRYPVNGRQSAAQIAGWVAARALRFRARGSPYDYSR